ncbi:MAG: 3-phosphoglycerate dehydrogenase [Deltaproteobacteria bacterium]|nr:3-phosphoglycerate dehydrogenase [Deltaproteobacteria bacterium]
MKALITASFHPSGIERLRHYMDVELDDWRVSKRIYFDGQQFAARIREVGADVLIVEADLVHDEVLDHCQLKIIGCCRGDPINIGIDKATQLGIPVLFAPARNADAVADLTVGYMLALARHIFTVNTLLKTGQMQFQSTKDYLSVYELYGGFELGGVTVGIVGFGAIGRAVARRLSGFGSTVVAYDPHVAADVFAAHQTQSVGLEELLQRCDILTVHCPDLPETQGLIGAQQIRMLKRGTLVLNLARAAIVDEDALYEALQDGQVGGAALDVFRDEPVQSTNRFVKLPNVLASPHLGGATRDVVRHQTDMVVDGIEAYLRGERPKHIVNPSVLERPR